MSYRERQFYSMGTPGEKQTFPYDLLEVGDDRVPLETSSSTHTLYCISPDY